MLQQLKELKASARGLLGLSQEEDSEASVSDAPHSTQTVPTASTNADGQGGELCRQLSVEIVGPTSTAAASVGTKRAREEDRSAPGGRKIKRTYSGSALSNLEPNYTAPKDAFQISKPTRPPSPYNFKKDWPEPSGPKLPSFTMGGQARHRGGVIPMDTLRQPGPQSAQSRAVFKSYHNNPHEKQNEIGRTKPSEQLETKGSRGPNVKHVLELPDNNDDFAGSQARKRQKIDRNNLAKHSVDLTDKASPNDDSPSNQTFGRTIGRKRDVLSHPAQVQVPRHVMSGLQKNKLNSIFVQSTSQEVWDATKIPQARRKRRNSANRGSRSPESSQNGTPRHGTQQLPVAIDDDEKPGLIASTGTSTTTSKDLTSKSNTMLPINLDQGIAEAGLAYQENKQRKQHMSKQHIQPTQGSRVDVRNTNHTLQDAVQKSRGNTQTQRTRPVSQRRETQKVDDYNSSAAAASQQLQQPNLRNRFVRDMPSQAQSQQRRAPEWMSDLPSSRVSLIEDSSEDDILNSATTVASPSLRRPSSQRAASSISRASPKSHWSGRTGPQSNTRDPTRNGSEPSLPRLQLAREGSSSPESTNSRKIRISIDAIHCKALSASEKGLELVWDDSEESFCIVHLKQKMTFLNSTGQRQPIMIGRRESHLGWIYNRKSCKVQLKGSSTNISQGSMVIAFSDPSGMRDCFLYFYWLSGEEMKNKQWQKEISVDEMERVFAKQLEESKILQQRAQVIRQQRTKRLGTLYAVQDSDNEQIRYEVDEQPEPQERPAKIRKRMQEEKSPSHTEALQEEDHQEPPRAQKGQGETSKYFDDRLRRSSRRARPILTRANTLTPPGKWTTKHKPKPWPHSVVYPAKGLHRVTVEFSDLERLDDGELLNDNVINFELRHIEEHMKPEHKQKVHFFNTYFYSALTTKGNNKGFNYDAVKRWTKKTELFDVPYVLVPINADLHWFIAIVCNLPNLERKCTALDDFANDGRDLAIERQLSADDRKDAVEDLPEGGGISDNARDIATPSDPPDASQDDGVSTFEADGKVSGPSDVQDSRPDPSRGRKSKRKPPAAMKYPTDVPIIISIDSFGQARSVEMKYLRQYIAKEADVRRGIDDVNLKSMTAKGLPEQSNFSDCGVYLCGYVAEFAKDPDVFVKKILQREMRTEDFANFDPSAKRDEIRNKILTIQEEQAADREAQKKTKAIANIKVMADAPTFSTRVATTQSSPVKSLGAKKQTPPGSRRAMLRHQGDEQRTRTTAGAYMDSDELEVSPPLALGTSPADAQGDDFSSDEEMLESHDEVATNDSYRHSHDEEPVPVPDSLCKSHMLHSQVSNHNAPHSSEGLLKTLQTEINKAHAAQERTREVAQADRSPSTSTSTSILSSSSASVRPEERAGTLTVIEIGEEGETQQEGETQDPPEQGTATSVRSLEF